MKIKNICPDCWNTEFKRDIDKKETYCTRCGLIVEDLKAIIEDHTFETANEPLSDGLDLEADMGKIERKNKFKSSSKNKYDKLKSRYLPILEDRLVEMGYNYSEALDIFNYCFKKFYIFDIKSNALIITDNGKKYQRTQKQVVEDFLTSWRFEAFDVSACVSKLKDSTKILGNAPYY